MDELEAATRARPPEEFDALSEPERSDLASLVERAACERSRLLDDAVENSLRHLPGLLRGTVKRALGV